MVLVSVAVKVFVQVSSNFRSSAFVTVLPGSAQVPEVLWVRTRKVSVVVPVGSSLQCQTGVVSPAVGSVMGAVEEITVSTYSNPVGNVSVSTTFFAGGPSFTMLMVMSPPHTLRLPVEFSVVKSGCVFRDAVSVTVEVVL